MRLWRTNVHSPPSGKGRLPCGGMTDGREVDPDDG